MNYSDLINGVFECIGGLLILISIYRLYKDKEVKGVSWVPTLFFTGWGLWNICFYFINGLLFSFIGGFIVATTSIIWLIQLVYYSRKKL
jgi:tetrahydromethanopterin S-methyltransferase subunit D